ncbi:VHS1113 protein [Vibrio phage 1]|nr:VHS1113 protein [Vibrio phage 1]
MPFTAIQGAALHAILSAHSATLTANDESLINTLSPKEAEDLRRALSLLNRVKESTVQRLSGAADIEPGEAVKVVTER